MQIEKYRNQESSKRIQFMYTSGQIYVISSGTEMEYTLETMERVEKFEKML